MNETLTLALAWIGGRGARRDFLRRPLVDGSQGRFVRTAGALVLRQPAAADEHCPGWLLFCRPAALGAAAAVSAWICHGAPGRDVADPAAGRHTRARRHRRPAMRLSPDQMIFWQHGFFKLNGTIVFTWGLMLVLAVGSKLITRKLSTDLKRSRWQNLLEIVVTGIEKQIEEVGLRHPREVSRLSGHALSVRRAGQPLHRHSRLRAADRLALDHRGAGAVRVCGRAAFRHRGAGPGRLPQVLRRADGHHAAVQHHQRTVAHAGPGRPPVRQHDERGDDHRAFC